MWGKEQDSCLMWSKSLCWCKPNSCSFSAEYSQAFFHIMGPTLRSGLYCWYTQWQE